MTQPVINSEAGDVRMCAGEERRLQRELRFICIMGPERRPLASSASAPQHLVSLGLVDDSGWVTPKGREFMKSALTG